MRNKRSIDALTTDNPLDLFNQSDRYERMVILGRYTGKNKLPELPEVRDMEFIKTRSNNFDPIRFSQWYGGRIKEIVNYLDKNHVVNNTVDIWRGINILPEYIENLDKIDAILGHSWTFQEDKAISYNAIHNSNFENLVPLKFHAQLDESKINWLSSVNRNIDYPHLFEREIKIKKGIPFNLKGMIFNKGPIDISSISNKKFYSER